MGAFITSFGTALPEHRISQQEIAGFLTRNLEVSEEKKRETEVLFRATGIQYRHTVLADYTRSVGDFEFFPNTPGLEPFPTVASRMEVYRAEALKLSIAAIKDCLGDHQPEEFTHLITVSCTGMYAPGLDFDLVKNLGFQKNIQRSGVNFMGCYAAFNAIRMAKDTCNANPNAKVLIVCVELCSLHFQKSDDPDTLLANSLFGDGAAAIVVESEAKNGLALEINNSFSDLITNGEHDMTWGIGNFGFEMTLSSYVPQLIREGIKTLTKRIFSDLGIEKSDIQHYAIHPGGKKILEAVEQELDISREENARAYEILRNYGNMSSPTILFVLQSIFKNLNQGDKGSSILGLAFGPGLTLESVIFKVS
ncbi:MAG: type III polyketide synthase [Cyclobacteriaceae bacterium]